MAKRTKAAALRILRERFGSAVTVLRCDADAARYEAAIDGYARTGDRAVVMRELLAIGVCAVSVRWHVANRGDRMMSASAGLR